MTNTCTSGCCWTSCLLLVVWWLASSGLLWLTWNRVVCAMTKMKAAKFSQALLLIATISVLCAPRWYMASRYGHSCGKGHCATSQHCCHQGCPHKGEGNEKGDREDCPYARHGANSESEPAGK